MKAHWNEVRAKCPISTGTHPIFLAGLGDSELLADYDYWSRMEWFNIDEMLWLIIGLNPKVEWERKFASQNDRKIILPHEHAHVESIREQLLRVAPTLTMRLCKLKGPELYDWIKETGFPAHPDCLEMLAKIASRKGEGPSPQPQNTRQANIPEEDPRAIAAVSRILTAIAIEEYGFDPDSQRSPIPREIENIMHKLGLQGSADTVRKYLRIGARDLPNDWKGGRY